MNIAELKDCIKKYEGYSAHIYTDTVGCTSVGWGFNLTENDIPLEVAQLLFDYSFNIAVKELEKFDWYLIQPEGVKAALVRMSFNLGITRLLKFKKMIGYLSVKDYTNSAREALDSRWSVQIGKRSNDIALEIRLGK